MKKYNDILSSKLNVAPQLLGGIIKAAKRKDGGVGVVRNLINLPYQDYAIICT